MTQHRRPSRRLLARAGTVVLGASVIGLGTGTIANAAPVADTPQTGAQAADTTAQPSNTAPVNPSTPSASTPSTSTTDSTPSDSAPINPSTPGTGTPTTTAPTTTAPSTSAPINPPAQGKAPITVPGAAAQPAATPAPVTAPAPAPAGDAPAVAATPAAPTAQVNAPAPATEPVYTGGYSVPETAWTPPSNPAPAPPAPAPAALPGLPHLALHGNANGSIAGETVAANVGQVANTDGYMATAGYNLGENVGTTGLSIIPTSDTTADINAFVGNADVSDYQTVDVVVDYTPVTDFANEVAAQANTYVDQAVDFVAQQGYEIPQVQVPQVQVPNFDVQMPTVNIGGVELGGTALGIF